MYIRFACTGCSKKLRVREENIGKKLTCPHCHHQMTVKAPPDIFAFDGLPDVPSPELQGAPPDTARTHSAADTGSFTDATEVSLKLSAVIGAILAAIFIGLMVPLKNRGIYLGNLFLDRGIVPFPLVFLMMWSAAILYLKSRKLKRQKESMLFDMLPNDVSESITPENATQFMKNIRDLPARPSESFLINRVIRGLDHFRVLQNSSEVGNRLAVQSEIDASAVESSYSMLKVFIWAIPILGFIGTVIGISEAVGGFRGDLADASMDELKDSLGIVTAGLATAFDTTLVALVMSMLVMFPTSSMQKAEEDLLNWVDEYCNENLLKRLKDSDDRQTGDAFSSTNSMQKAIDRAMANHHAELRSWTKKLETIGETVSGQVTKGWTRVNDQVQAHYKQNLGKIDNTVHKMIDHQKTIVKRIEEVELRTVGYQKEHVKQFKDVVAAAEKRTELMMESDLAYRQEVEADLSALVRSMDDSTNELQQSLKSAAEDAANAQSQSSQSMQEAANALGTYLQTLNEGLTGLNSVLADLGEKQIVIETHPAAEAEASKRGWGWFGRRNGR